MERFWRGLGGLLKALAVLLVAWALLFAFLHAVRANAQPEPSPDPCARGPCKVTGAAVGVKIPLPLAPGHFFGKLVMSVEDHSGCGPRAQAAGKPCKVQDCGGRTCWAIERPFTYKTHAGDLITVPAGMTTDLASVPRFAWALIPPDGPWVQAAIVHDFLYRSSGSCVLWKGHASGCSRARPYVRAEADKILDDAMADLGVGAFDRITIWSGVRAGGHNGWSH